MTDGELREKIDLFIRVTEGVLSPKRGIIARLLGKTTGLAHYETTVELETADTIEYDFLIPQEAGVEASPELFHQFGQQLRVEKEIPDSIVTARLALRGNDEILVIEACDRSRGSARAFLPLARDKSNFIVVAGDPVHETDGGATISNLRWNAASEVMRAFLDDRAS